MKRWLVMIGVLAAILPVAAMPVAAAPDQYGGDTSIYGGATAAIQPNVLIIIDTSGSMADSVPSTTYDPSTTYPAVNACGNYWSPQACSTNTVYQYSNSTYTSLGVSVTNVTTTCSGVNPQSLLQTTGEYSGRKLTTSGACSNRGSGTYYIGNYINWLLGPNNSMRPKIDIAKEVIKNLVTSTTGVKFGLMRYHYVSGSGQGAEFISALPSGLSSSYVTTVKNMDDIFSGTTTNRQALTSVVDNLAANGNTPLGESLFEAMRYFTGGAPAFGSTVGVTSGKYTSPIESSCQKNYVIVVTDGMANADDSSVLKTICSSGDCDGDGQEPNNLDHILDDVAKYLYDNDLSTGYDGKQNVTTYAIGFGDVGSDATAVDLLNRATDSSHGHGQAFLAGNQTQLAAALTQVMSQIFSVDTSFVAPVVPVSPENKTYNASRVYMGFFKPVNQTYWAGNLKKYGLDSNSNLIDQAGVIANYVDLDGDRTDDNSGVTLPTGAVNGTFKASSVSYWNSIADGGQVDEGGAGSVLESRDFGANPRKIYTYVSTNTDLTDASNAFSTGNTNITATTLNVADSATKDKLINFITGYDAYDENLNSNTTEKRAWVFGDVLHAKPLVVNFKSYTVSSSTESNWSYNQTMIFVGDNDGMLHAIKDCDGSEAWAFIPPAVLPNLKEIPGQTHTYFVDSSPVVYIYDKNGNGSIDTGDGDKVILLFGLRRGGGTNTLPATGYYYALDVSNPLSPRYLWSISGADTNFGNLGESFSEPRITKMKIGSEKDIVAFIGGGYDNLNEDSRYGATQTYNGTGTVTVANNGGGAYTSDDGSVPLTPRGGAIYAVKIASLNNAGVPTVVSTPTKIWSCEYGTAAQQASAPANYSTGMTFSFPGEIANVDTDANGYTDRLYAVDLGGNLWRFNVGSSTVSSWRGYKIFSANSGADGTVGRKAFYKPAVSLESTFTSSSAGRDALILFGTGDREHPLNLNVVDRLYAVRDKGQTSAKSESDLVDVTTDDLQSPTADAATVKNTLDALSATSNYGWYIKLNQNTGEKVLASPTLFNKVIYFTTFSPSTTSTVDPCQPANLGSSLLYALNYQTGEAVQNYDKSNDTASTTNVRAFMNGSNSSNGVLLRSDRVMTLGQGIPSGVVLIVNSGGEVKGIVGTGGNIAQVDVKKYGGIVPLYWRQK